MSNKEAAVSVGFMLTILVLVYSVIGSPIVCLFALLMIWLGVAALAKEDE